MVEEGRHAERAEDRLREVDANTLPRAAVDNAHPTLAGMILAETNKDDDHKHHAPEDGPRPRSSCAGLDCVVECFLGRSSRSHSHVARATETSFAWADSGHHSATHSYLVPVESRWLDVGIWREVMMVSLLMGLRMAANAMRLTWVEHGSWPALRKAAADHLSDLMLVTASSGNLGVVASICPHRSHLSRPVAAPAL